MAGFRGPRVGAQVGSTADELVRRFRWIDGHADIWPWFADAELLWRMVAALAAPYRARRVTKVAGLEARGFVLGAAVAVPLGAGFVPMRKSGGLFRGELRQRESAPDYRERRHALRVQRNALGPRDRVLIVDDWLETGAQLATAQALVREAGAVLVVRPDSSTTDPAMNRPSLERSMRL